MATYSDGDRVTKVSAVDLSTKAYHCVKTDANNKAVLAGAADVATLGVIADGGRKIGDTVDIVLFNGTGTFKVKTGAAVVKDALLTSNANGEAVTATAAQRAFGRACYAGNSGDIVEYYKLDRVA